MDIAALRLRSKTGAKAVHLGQSAVEALKKIERVAKNPWDIVGTKPGARLSDLQPFWQRVRARAGLKDVRIHDLQHTFLDHGGRRPGAADDRQAARPDPGPDDGALRPRCG